MPKGASWVLLYRPTGRVWGSPNLAVAANSSESVIKAWIAYDYLRTHRPTAAVSTMIRDSANGPAHQLWGHRDSFNRLVRTCGLSDARYNDQWSEVNFSARDLARMGSCLARVASPWLLTEMRSIRGDGAFGLPFGMPEYIRGRVMYKNGWTFRNDGWHVNCMASVADWALGVTYVHPPSLRAAATVCANVARSLLG